MIWIWSITSFTCHAAYRSIFMYIYVVYLIYFVDNEQKNIYRVWRNISTNMSTINCYLADYVTSLQICHACKKNIKLMPRFCRQLNMSNISCQKNLHLYRQIKIRCDSFIWYKNVFRNVSLRILNYINAYYVFRECITILQQNNVLSFIIKVRALKDTYFHSTMVLWLQNVNVRMVTTYILMGNVTD